MKQKSISLNIIKRRQNWNKFKNTLNNLTKKKKYWV
jgi:hypothetical protein